MMAAMQTGAALPAIRGRVRENAPLAPVTWFRVGGNAEFLVRPEDADDLAKLLRELALEMPVTVIGAASNLIVRDGGIPGVVIKLGRGFNEIVVDEEGVIAGAACLDITVAEVAASAGLTGLEFLSGIPGSIGGAVAMNAGNRHPLRRGFAAECRRTGVGLPALQSGAGRGCDPRQAARGQR
jgi:UDP-N-acetylmuramate dehydrogenase